MTESEKIVVIPTQNESDKLKSIEVNKLVDLEIDLGTLLVRDLNDLSEKDLRDNTDIFLQDLARENTQALVNQIWNLKTDRVEDAIVAQLPEPTYRLPREKPVPKAKPLTKWQEFAKKKGINTKKKGNLTWDEVLKKWVPKHGFKKAAAEREKDWVIEIPDHADPYVDYFQKKKEEKKEKIAKNEFQRLRNLAKAKNIKVPTMGLPPTEKLSSVQLNTAAKLANVSTASLGKFQPRMSKEKQLSKGSILKNKKRKPPHMSEEQEKKSNLEIAQMLLNKRPKLDLEKAVNRELHAEQETQSSKKQNKPKNKGKGGGGGKKGKVGKKNNLGKGKNFKKGGAGGRKRR